MDPISTTYYASTHEGISALTLGRQREDARDAPSAQVGAQIKTPPASVPSPASETQLGIQSREKMEREPLTYGPDGRRTGEERSTTTQAVDKKNLEKFPGNSSKLDPQVQMEIARLQAIDAKVKAHEAAHKAAGGTMTGPVSYTYTRGPDGKTYVTGGEVPISVSPGKTPQETARKMQQVIQAALAPADPSPQDRAVAAQAASLAQQARQEESATPAPASSPSGGASVVQDGSTGTSNAQYRRSAYEDPAVTGLAKPSDSGFSSKIDTGSSSSTVSTEYPGGKRSPLSGVTSGTTTGSGPARQVSFHI